MRSILIFAIVVATVRFSLADPPRRRVEAQGYSTNISSVTITDRTTGAKRSYGPSVGGTLGLEGNNYVGYGKNHDVVLVINPSGDVARAKAGYYLDANGVYHRNSH